MQATTKQSYYRARYYDMALGRFISEDPLAFGSGDVNFYAYVRNDPTDLIDPFGLRPGDKYPNARCAGWNAVNDYNATSDAQNKEYGGLIYQNPDGTFSYTDPHVNPSAKFPLGLGVGDDHSIPGFWKIPIPAGTQTQGWYHTHPGQVNDISGDFSPADKGISDLNPPRGLGGKIGVLGLSNGVVKLYLPSPDNPTHGITLPINGTLPTNGRNCGCKQ